MLTATNPAQKSLVLLQRPDNSAYGARMVKEVRSSLREKWALPYVIWMLNYHTELGERSVSDLIDAVGTYHKGSPLMGEFCVALVAAGKSDSKVAGAVMLTQKKLKFMEAIVKEASSKVVQGQTALALSSVLAKMGDSPKINKRRLSLIRKSIIDAADSKIGKYSVADLAKEEIYRMTKLSKGVRAPELVGQNASGVPMKLSDSLGKVVILIFWSSWEQSDEVIAFAKKMENTYLGRPVEVIGVNRDSTANFRKLVQADHSMKKSFSDPNEKLFSIYRVQHSPVCYVLDEKGVIRYNGSLGSFADLAVSALLSERAR